MSRVLLITLLLFTTFATGFGQKFGHVNFGNLLNEMPATETADKELEAYQQQLVAKGEKMVKDLREAAELLDKEIPNLAPVEANKRRAKLQQDQQAIVAFEQKMPMMLEEKRRELLTPIINRAKEAINAVGKEQGFAMIFDSSLFNSLLFTQEGTDLLPAVKAKLGL
ncbi:MAG: OmpH family outer membrane protein [Bacteroidota bacterium]